MIDQQLDNPPTTKGKISRRDFLRLSGGAIGGWLIGSVAGRWIAATYGNEIAEQIGRIRLSEEAKKMIPEIVRFRESLGLEGLPAEAEKNLLKKESWTSKSENFTNALPEKNRSYGFRINEIMIILFGQNGQRLVKGAKTDYKYPYGMCFDPNDRRCNVSDNVHCIPIEDKFTDYVLHEAAGHGSDPSLNLIMPPELLIKVEYGKWMALSECLSVEGQFLNHPHDLMFPLLKRSIGETIGKSMVDNRGIDDIVDERSIAAVTQIITKVAERRRKNIGDLKFNKSVCREIGEALVSLLRNGQIKFRGELKKEYQNSMEIACVEIYAEMVKYALLYPELIGRNQNILNGVKQIFSAFQDKPVADIDDSRIKIQSPSKNVLDRYVAEKAFLTQTITDPALSPTLTAEQQERVKKEQEEFERKEKAFKDFVNKGKIPRNIQIPSGQRETIENFARLCSEIIKKYPTLEDTFAQQYNDTFDPELHIWEIREIEDAINTSFIRNLIACSNITDQDYETIKNKITILEKFMMCFDDTVSS